MHVAKQGRSVPRTPKPRKMSSTEARAAAEHERRWPIEQAYMLAGDCLRAAQDLVMWIRGTETWAHPDEVHEYTIIDRKPVSVGHNEKVARLQWAQWDRGFNQIAGAVAQLMRARRDLSEPLRLHCGVASEIYQPTDPVIGYWRQHERFRILPDSQLMAVKMLADALISHLDDNAQLWDLSKAEPWPDDLVSRVRKVLPGTSPNESNSYSLRCVMEKWRDLPTASELDELSTRLSREGRRATRPSLPVHEERDARKNTGASSRTRLKVNVKKLEIRVGAVSHAVPDKRLCLIVERIVNAGGQPVSGEVLKESMSPTIRLDRLFKKLPAEVRDRIKGRRGLGYWLT